MRRVSKQYFILICIFGGLVFFVFLLHTHRTSPVIADDSRIPVQKPDYKELSDRLAQIEHEVESQVHDSAVLLDRLRVKNVNGSLKEALSGVHGNKAKLAELHRVLDEADHLGEVNSGGDGEGERAAVAVGGEEDKNGAYEVVEESREAVIAILVFVCNRPTVTRCLDKLLEYRPVKSQYPIILSQDCGRHEKTLQALKPYESELQHIFQPDLSYIEVDKGHEQYQGYYKIARHYGWALNHVFNQLNYSTVVIVEDDIEVAPDFFDYFSATLPILKKDPTLWCVSAWNDNGKSNLIDMESRDLLYRTDFFPGLGWMLTKELWTELGPKWPRGFWDDWMREPAQRQGRACIRPEISRTSTFGRVGVSLGTYFQSHLKFIKLNDKFVNFSSLDLSYLTKDNYDNAFVTQVGAATLLGSLSELPSAGAGDKDENLKIPRFPPPKTTKEEFRLEYGNNAQFVRLAKQLGLMEDLRAGVPRTAYLGIVSTMSSQHRVYLAPNSKLPGYKS